MSTVDEVVGRNVRCVREAAGISQAGLARAVNLPLEELAAAERGVRRLSAARLFQLSGALKVPVGRLLSEASQFDAEGLKVQQKPDGA